MSVAENRAATRENRAIGAFIGLAVGDAVGTAAEFRPRDSYAPITDMVGGGPFRLRVGQWTDDTSVALGLAESILACGELDPADLAGRFCRWWQDGEKSATGRCFDIGNTTRAALARFLQTGDPLAGSTDPSSAGNGSIMRLAPVPIYWRDDEHTAADMAALPSRTTHGSLEAVDSCRLLAMILVRLINGLTLRQALDAGGFDGLSESVAPDDEFRSQGQSEVADAVIRLCDPHARGCTLGSCDHCEFQGRNFGGRESGRRR